MPLIVLPHFSAVLDDWDPRVIDGIAARRRVIAFDNRGIGASSGSVPTSVEEMARDAITFIRALGFVQVDLLGFSLGGFVAQVIALEQPLLVRRLVLAGTGPAGGADGTARLAKAAVEAFARSALTRRHPKHFLFFPHTQQGDRAATDYMARLKERTEDRDRRISPLAALAQIKAIRAFRLGAPHDLSAIHQPTLVANGDDDVMLATKYSTELARRLPNARLRIYPAAGHGGVFQHHDQFVPEVLDLLEDRETAGGSLLTAPSSERPPSHTRRAR